MDSILTSIKKLLGITEEYEHFNADLIMHINSVFMILNQLGVGPDGGFAITDATETWSDFMPSSTTLQLIKSYMYLKVKLLFDPPMSGAVTEAIQQQLNEFEWRLRMQADYNKEVGADG